MTATFFLVRHAAHDFLDRRLVGRMAGVRLGSEGRAQAERLAQHFSVQDVGLVQSSPIERALETAEPIAARLAIDCESVPALDEIEIGEWTGMSFDELHSDPRWADWNTRRSIARPPGGETMLEVQARVIGHLERLRVIQPETRAVLVSHSDVIKAAILHFLGMPLDAYQRIEIAPASVSMVVMGNWGAKVVALNERPAA